MSHPVERIIEDYERMRNEFATAIRKAGGMSEVVMDNVSFRAVMATLFANNIVIEANYVGDHPRV